MENNKEQFEIMQAELEAKEAEADVTQNPIWDVLTSFISPAGGVVASVRKQYDRSLAQRRRDFLEMIRDTAYCVRGDDVRSFDYITDLKIGLEAIERVTFNEKIAYIANLFRSTHSSLEQMDSDEYQENLRKITELSYREIDLLSLLYQNPSGINDREYMKQVQNKYPKLTVGEIHAILLSLTKTGFCKETVSTRLNYQGNEFKTTELLERFLKNIGVNDGMTDEERAAKRERLEKEDREKLVQKIDNTTDEDIYKILNQQEMD